MTIYLLLTIITSKTQIFYEVIDYKIHIRQFLK